MLIPSIAVALVFISTQVYALSSEHRSTDNELCEKNEYYNSKTGDCEPCSECSEFLYTRAECTSYSNTVCGWCGSQSVIKNEDFLLKCKNRNSERNKFDSEYRSKVFDELWRDSDNNGLIENLDDINSDEIIDIDRLPISRLLPPLPSSRETDEKIETSSEFKVSPLRPLKIHWWPIKKRMDIGFAPLSGKQFYSNYKKYPSNQNEDIEAFEESQTMPIKEDKDSDTADMMSENYSKEDNQDVKSAEEIDSYMESILVVTEKISTENDWQWFTESTLSYADEKEIFASRCLKIAAYLWLVSLSLIIYIIIKWKRSQYKRRNYFLPPHNQQFLTKEQCDMIHRSAENIKNINNSEKASAIYENKLAYV